MARPRGASPKAATAAVPAKKPTKLEELVGTGITLVPHGTSQADVKIQGTVLSVTENELCIERESRHRKIVEFYSRINGYRCIQTHYSKNDVPLDVDEDEPDETSPAHGASMGTSVVVATPPGTSTPDDDDDDPPRLAQSPVIADDDEEEDEDEEEDDGPSNSDDD